MEICHSGRKPSICTMIKMIHSESISSGSATTIAFTVVVSVADVVVIISTMIKMIQIPFHPTEPLGRESRWVHSRKRAAPSPLSAVTSVAPCLAQHGW